MRRGHQARHHILLTTRQVDPLHVGTHSHHAGHRTIGQAQHAADHLVLGRLQPLVGVHLLVHAFVVVAVRRTRAQHPQHGIGGALAERLAALVALTVETHPLVERLDQDRKAIAAYR
jgi:hypothetical protein